MDGFEVIYKKEEQQIKDMWSSAIFVCDTNVLLNLYRYTEDTRGELLSILKNIGNQLWIPHHVALEYNLNRLNVIQEQKDSYGSINKSIEKNYSSFISSLSSELSVYKRHPHINIKDILTSFEEMNKSINNLIQNANTEHPDFFVDDPVIREINILYANRVGNAYDQARVNEIEKEGEKRYQGKIPPGYMDLKDKKSNKKYWDGVIYSEEYGDLYIWYQMIDKALNINQPIIFITDDEKEDWWYIIKNRITVGPRYELLSEFRTKTKQDFYIYKTYKFMEYANNYLDRSENTQAITEARELKSPTDLFINGRLLLLPYVNDDDWETYLKLMENAEDGNEINTANSWVIARNIESLNNLKVLDISPKNYLIKGYAKNEFNSDSLLKEINYIYLLKELIISITLNRTIYNKGDMCEITLKLSKGINHSQLNRMLGKSYYIDINQIIDI